MMEEAESNTILNIYIILISIHFSHILYNIDTNDETYFVVYAACDTNTGFLIFLPFRQPSVFCVMSRNLFGFVSPNLIIVIIIIGTPTNSFHKTFQSIIHTEYG